MGAQGGCPAYQHYRAGPVSRPRAAAAAAARHGNVDGRVRVAVPPPCRWWCPRPRAEADPAVGGGARGDARHSQGLQGDGFLSRPRQKLYVVGCCHACILIDANECNLSVSYIIYSPINHDVMMTQGEKPHWRSASRLHTTSRFAQTHP